MDIYLIILSRLNKIKFFDNVLKWERMVKKEILLVVEED